MSHKVLSDDETTRLVMDLNFIGSKEELQSRLDNLTSADSRVIVGDIETVDGRITCGVSYNCDSYDPPVDGEPDPKAIEDLVSLLREHVNFDGCAYWRNIGLLTREPV